MADAKISSEGPQALGAREDANVRLLLCSQPASTGAVPKG
jgi:hypothetical protein